MLANQKKVEYAAHAVISIILIALLIVASFFDQKISSALFSVNFISKIGAVLGKIPAYFIFAFAGAVLAKSASLKEKRYRTRLPLIMLYVIVTFMGSVMLGYSMVDDIVTNKLVKLLITGILTLLTMATVLSLVRLITADKINMLKKWAFTSLITIAVIIIAIAVIKISWGRVRYEDIVIGRGEFSPWYIPQGYTGNKSMPSGHVALSACLFLLVPMFRALPNMRSVAVGMVFISIAFTVAVAFSRIMGGHHFLSDVTVAIMISYITISVSNLISYGTNADRYMLSQNNILNRL